MIKNISYKNLHTNTKLQFFHRQKKTEGKTKTSTKKKKKP